MSQFKFAVPPVKPSLLNFAFFPLSLSKTESISAGSLDHTVALPPSITLPYKVFVIPSWNTTCAVKKSAGSFLIEFAIPPAADSKLHWGIVP